MHIYNHIYIYIIYIYICLVFISIHSNLLSGRGPCLQILAESDGSGRTLLHLCGGSQDFGFELPPPSQPVCHRNTLINHNQPGSSTFA